MSTLSYSKSNLAVINRLRLEREGLCMSYRKGDVVNVDGFAVQQVITQDHEGDQIDVIEEDEYGAVDVTDSSLEDGVVRNIISESDIEEKVDEVSLE